MISDREHPIQPQAGRDPRPEGDHPDSGDRDERRRETLQRFGYEPAIIYALAAATDHSRPLGCPF